MSSNCLIRHMRPECECGDTCAIQDIIDDETKPLKEEISRLKQSAHPYVNPDRLAALAQILAPRYPDAVHELARVREIARNALKDIK